MSDGDIFWNTQFLISNVSPPPQDLGSSMGLWLGLGVIQAVETVVSWLVNRLQLQVLF